MTPVGVVCSGNIMTIDQEAAKLRLCLETALEVWLIVIQKSIPFSHGSNFTA